MTDDDARRDATILRPADVAERVPVDRSAPLWINETPDVRLVHAALGTDQVQVNMVYLPAGTRSRPHAHTCDQVIFCLTGTMIVAVDGGEDRPVEPGQFAMLPGGVAHMHGATPDGPATHLSVMRDLDVDFDPPVSEAWTQWRLG